MPDINMQHFGELQRNQHSIDVEIDASHISSYQKDFPMMLETPNSSNSVLNVVAINELGEQLPTETEGISNDKNWVHFKDSIQGIVNSKIKVFYGGFGGKPAADSTYGSKAIWVDYSAVYHMNNDPTNDAPQILDSIGNYHGTSEGSMTPNDLVNTDYGLGLDFDDNDDAIDISANGFPYSTVTVFLRMKPKFALNDGLHHYLYSSSQTSSNNNRIQLRKNTTDNYNCLIYNSSGTLQSTLSFDDNLIPQNTWANIVFQFKTNDAILYLNGISKSTDSSVTTPTSINPLLTIGNWVVPGTTFDSNSVISEVRVMGSYADNNYILTSHNNLNNPTANGESPFYKSISKELNFAESLQSLGRAG